MKNLIAYSAKVPANVCGIYVPEVKSDNFKIDLRNLGKYPVPVVCKDSIEVDLETMLYKNLKTSLITGS